MNDRIRNFSKDHPRGVNFGDLLQLAFIVLKLSGIINWPWVWVLSPMWIPLLMAFGIAAVLIAVEEVHRKINKEASKE